MYSYMLTMSYLLIASTYTTFMPKPELFPYCAPADVGYFAYTLDHQRAIKICMEIDGWRFNYGPVDNHKKIVSFYIPKDDIDKLRWGNEYGIIVANYAVLTDPQGITRLRINSEIAPIGNWANFEILDDKSTSYINHFYDKKMVYPLR